MINIESFKKWLEQNGCEILPCTNEYEQLRFRGAETGILYYTGKVNSQYTKEAKNAFRKGTKWDGGPISTGRLKDYKWHKKQLLKRDGTKCFYCGEELGNDISLEHLIPLNQNGPNSLSNMVLCHKKENQLMGHRPISEKVKYAIEKRSKK